MNSKNKRHLKTLKISKNSGFALLITWMIFNLFGCGPAGVPIENGVIRAEVLSTILLGENDDPANAPTFQLGPAEFHTLKDVDNLTGDYFSLVRGGTLTAKSIDGSLIDTTGYVGSENPRLRYSVKNGVVIPSDNESLLMLSSYFQFEQIARTLESAIGISMDTIKKKTGLIKILFYPSVHFMSSSASVRAVIKTNAAFDPKSFQFLIMPSSKAEEVPLGGNLQVLAHEFGHLIFSYFLQPPGIEKEKSIEEFLNQFDIRGINEGFADFVSYSITGSTHVLGGSLTGLTSSQRNFSKIDFNYDMIRNFIFPFHNGSIQEKCSGNFYCTGTVFAKSLYLAKAHSIYPSNSLEDRLGFLSLITNSFGSIRAHILKDPSAKINPLGVFLKAFTSSLTGSSAQRNIFQSLTSQFGRQGYPEHLRDDGLK